MHPTINLGDNDIHFSSRPFLSSDEVGQNNGGVLKDGVDAAKTDEEIPVTNVESKQQC